MAAIVGVQLELTCGLFLCLTVAIGQLDKVKLFHHTDFDAAKKIASSGKILKSQESAPSDDARFGNGTYLTSIGPDSSKTSVAKNNFDGIWQNNLHKTEVAIEVVVRASKVSRCESDRNVWLYDGDLYFSDCQDVKFHVRSDGHYITYSLDKFKHL